MRYVIMANGRGRRWKNYLGIPKHLAPTPDGETLVGRTVRLALKSDSGAEVIVSAHDKRYTVPGARLYTPHIADLEFDRFVPELIDRPCCFLYGDAYYTEDAMSLICDTLPAQGLLVFGNERRIFALMVEDYERVHDLVCSMRQRIIRGEIADCRGWHLYHAFYGMPLEGKDIGEAFVHIDDETTDLNTAEEYRTFMHEMSRSDEAC